MNKDRMNPTPAAALLSPSDIAKLADVSAAAVSNWRKRAADFPAQAGGTEKRPLFSRNDVVEWLQATGKKIVSSSNADAVAAFNILLDGRRRSTAPSTPLDAATAVIALMCAKKYASEEPAATSAWQEFLSTSGTRLTAALWDVDLTRWDEIVTVDALTRGDDPGALETVAYMIDRIPVEDLPEAADAVLNRLNAAAGRGGSEHGYINSRVSTFLAQIAHEDAHGQVLDPACGMGDLLTQLQAMDTGGRIDHLTAYDINLDAIILADQRSFLSDAPMSLHAHDVLADDFQSEARYDLIAVEPPFGLSYERYDLTDPRWSYGTPPRRSSEMAWIQHTVHHLAEDGIGFVVTPHGPLFQGGAVERIRRALLENGCISAIYQLPAKLLQHTSLPLAVWVLRSEGSQTVRFVHADSTEVNGDRASFEEAHPLADVSVADVLAGDANLVPARWIGLDTPDPATLLSEYHASTAALSTALATLPRELSPVASPAGNRVRTMTVGDLVAEQWIDLIRPRHHRLGEDQEELLRAAHLYDGRIAHDAPAASDALLASSGPLTQPGDVVACTTGRLLAVVDTEGGHLLSPNLFALRILTSQILPEYLALAVEGNWNLRYATGTALPRVAPKDIEVPLIPVDEQQRVVDLVTELRDLKAAAEALAAAASRTITHLGDLLRWSAQS